MRDYGDLYHRCIYACIFPDKKVYIGLTYSIKERGFQRRNNNNDAATRYSIESGLEYTTKQLTNYIDVEVARLKEGYYVELYESMGYEILNRCATGGIGGGYKKWTYEACKEESGKYIRRSQFREGNATAYGTSLRHGWLDDFFLKTPKWTYEKCKEVANSYEGRKDFSLYDKGAYIFSLRNNWLDDFFPQTVKWTYEKCKEVALNCKSYSDFISSGAYHACRREGWIDELCGHLEKKKPFPGSASN